MVKRKKKAHTEVWTSLTLKYQKIHPLDVVESGWSQLFKWNTTFLQKIASS